MQRPALDEMIWQVVASIPRGKVVTYGQVAQLCGFTNHARYVGVTLKRLPPDTTLPWHRVVNASGAIAFAEGSAAYQRQKALLEAEGVLFDGKRLSLDEYGWT